MGAAVELGWQRQGRRDNPLWLPRAGTGARPYSDGECGRTIRQAALDDATRQAKYVTKTRDYFPGSGAGLCGVFTGTM